MEKNINDIITTYFNREYFISGSLEKQERIKQQVVRFKERYPNLEKTFFSKFKDAFPNTSISNWTNEFFTGQCVRFRTELNADTRKTYVFQLSIFGYFTVYFRPRVQINGKYKYGETVYINPGCNPFCDNVYANCLTDQERSDFEWLPEEVLNTAIEAFSRPPVTIGKITLDGKVTVAHALFTNHII